MTTVRTEEGRDINVLQIVSCVWLWGSSDGVMAGITTKDDSRYWVDDPGEQQILEDNGFDNLMKKVMRK